MPDYYQAFRQTKKNSPREVERMRSYADSLKKRGEVGPTEVVSGVVVKKSPLELLSKAIQSGMGSYYEGKANQKEHDMEQAKMEALYRALGGGALGSSGSSGGLDPAMTEYLMANDPDALLKYKMDISKPTDVQKNYQWAGMGGSDYASMERQKAYGGAVKEGYSAGMDANGNIVANPVTVGGQDINDVRMNRNINESGAIEANKANIAAGADMITVDTPQGPRMMSRAQALQMAGQPPAQAPLSVRNNNPLNLRPVGQDQGFQQFQTPEAGMDAGMRDLTNKITGRSPIMQERYGPNYTPTIENVISTWAPPSENDTAGYIQYVSKQTGIAPNQPLRPQDANAIAGAMVQMEGGQAATDFYKDQMPGIALKKPASPIDTTLNNDFVTNARRPAIEQAAGAQEANARLEALRSIDLTGNTGWGTETRAAAANILVGLGMAGEDAQKLATDAQTFKSVVSKQVNEELMLQKGPQTEGDARRAFNIQAQLGNTPQANQFIIDLAQATNNQKIRKAQFYSQAPQDGNVYQLEAQWQQMAPSVFDDPLMQKYKTMHDTPQAGGLTPQEAAELDALRKKYGR